MVKKKQKKNNVKQKKSKFRKYGFKYVPKQPLTTA
jgi:hypothetical protein